MREARPALSKEFLISKTQVENFNTIELEFLPTCSTCYLISIQILG